MDSQTTLVPAALPNKSLIQLTYKRNSSDFALLLDHNDVPRFFLSTSDDGVSNIKIRDSTSRMFVKTHRNLILSDAFVFANRNDGRSVKVSEVLKKVSHTIDGQETQTVALNTTNGIYHWIKSANDHFTLFAGDDFSSPVAWTETTTMPTLSWMLVLEQQIVDKLDYILASLFYLKSGLIEEKDGWESMNSQVAYLSM